MFLRFASVRGRLRRRVASGDRGQFEPQPRPPHDSTGTETYGICTQVRTERSFSPTAPAYRPSRSDHCEDDLAASRPHDDVPHYLERDGEGPLMTLSVVVARHPEFLGRNAQDRIKLAASGIDCRVHAVTQF